MRVLSVLFLFFLAPNLFPQDAAEPSPAQAKTPYVEKEEREIKFYPGGKLEVTAGVPGALKIIGWQKAAIRMEAEKIVYYQEPEEAKAALKKNPVRLRYNQTSSSIRTGAAEVAMEINLTLYVPGDRLEVTAKMVQGDFSVSGVNGWVEVSIAGQGSLEASSMSGYFSANTLRGDISVEMSGNRWKGFEFAAVTRSGSADLRIPEKYSAALQLETRNGKITVDYPPQVVDGEEQPPEIMISKSSQSLKATLGDGGPPVKLVTHSGDITLSKIEQQGQAPDF
jgi:DUF4097 and DUF4098 domain-containing protein YvlB